MSGDVQVRFCERLGVRLPRATHLVNPPELGLFEKLVRRVPRGRAVLIQAGEDAHGHSTHTWPATYRQQLTAFLTEISGPR